MMCVKHTMYSINVVILVSEAFHMDKSYLYPLESRDK